MLKNSGLYITIKNMSDEDFYISGPKDYDEQTDAFRFDLDDLIYRYIDEFDINTFVMVGALQEKIKELLEANDSEMDLENLKKMKTKVIGITGFARSGKDTFYKYSSEILNKANCNRYAFADALKRVQLFSKRKRRGFIFYRRP